VIGLPDNVRQSVYVKPVNAVSRYVGNPDGPDIDTDVFVTLENNGNGRVYFNLRTMSVANTSSNVVASGIIDEGNGWYRLWYTGEGVTIGSGNTFLIFSNRLISTFDPYPSGEEEIHVCGMMFEFGDHVDLNAPPPPYQKVSAGSRDITEQGAPSFGVLSHDTDDAMVTQVPAGGTYSLLLPGKAGQYYVPEVTFAAPSAITTGPVSVLDDGAVVAGTPTGILHAAGAVPWSSRLELCAPAVLLKPNLTDEELRRETRYWEAHGAGKRLVEGVDQAVNGAAATDTDWTKGTGWTWGAGAFNKVAGAESTLEQAQTIVAGRAYICRYDLTRTAGGIRPRFAGGTAFNGTAQSASGSYAQILVGRPGNTTWAFLADGSFVGSIDNMQLIPLIPES